MSIDKEIDIPGGFAITAHLDIKFVDMLSKLRKRLADVRSVHLTKNGCRISLTTCMAASLP